MKRFLLTVILVAVIAAVMFYYMPRNLQTYIPRSADIKCYVYCRQTTLSAIDVGYGFIVETDGEKLCETISECNDIDGISFRFSADKTDYGKIVGNLCGRCSVTENFGDTSVVCCYSPRISGYVIVDGQRVNLQIAYSDGVINIGSPLIMGDY